MIVDIVLAVLLAVGWAVLIITYVRMVRNAQRLERDLERAANQLAKHERWHREPGAKELDLQTGEACIEIIKSQMFAPGEVERVLDGFQAKDTVELEAKGIVVRLGNIDLDDEEEAV